MLEPDKEYKNVFPEFSIVGLRNGKSLKEYLVRGALPKIDSARGSRPGGKGTCQLTLLQQKYVGMYCKSKHRSFRKGKQNVQQKRFHSHYVEECYVGIDDSEITLFGKCEIHK